MLDYSTLTMHLWQFNSRFLKCCLFYRKISGSFSSTVRDIYILVVVQEVMKFDPAPVIRPPYKAMHIRSEKIGILSLHVSAAVLV